MFGSSKERINALEQALSKAQKEIQALHRELDIVRKEAKKLQLAKGFAEIMLEAEKETNTRLLAQLAKEEKNPCPSRRHNERGAGRKPRATPEIVSFLHVLRNQGLSLSQMADELATQTGESWSKSTVAYMLKKYAGADSAK